MKYGIDIDSEKILSSISEKLNRRGHFIVNFTYENNINSGKLLLKKVIMANVTNIDFYFSINFNKDTLFPEILYNKYTCSKIFANEIKNVIKFKYNNIECKNGENLYLLINIKAPVVCIKFPLKDKVKIEKLLLTDKITDLLENIKL